MFELNPSKKFEFKVEVKEGEWITITFDFPYAEDTDYTLARQILKDLPQLEEDVRKKNIKAKKKLITYMTPEQESAATRVMFNQLRSAIVDCTGFGVKGKDFNIKDEKGNIIDVNQKCIFEFVKNHSDLYEKVLVAYQGELDAKNLTIGLQAPLLLDGVPQNVLDATK